MNGSASQGGGRTSPMPKRVWRFLARVDVAIALLFVVLLLVALGSCFPQLSSSTAADAGRLAVWESQVHARYGSLTPFLRAVGAFRWFTSPPFWLSVALLALATLVCTLNRWSGVWRRASHRPGRCPEGLFERAPHTTQLGPPPGHERVPIVRGCLERRGFRVRSQSDGGGVCLRGDRYGWAPLATLVTHLAVLLLLAGVALSGATRWREEIEVAPDGTVGIGHGTGLAVRSEDFTVTRYADGSVAGYQAHVTVVEGGRDAARGSIRLNQPLTYDGVGLYLWRYAEEGSGYRLTLLAVHDPGFTPVIVAGSLLLLGLTVSFHFPHCSVQARVEAGGALRLAGRSDRRAWDFGREFAALVEEIERAPLD